jgi:hypothetical protein
MLGKLAGVLVDAHVGRHGAVAQCLGELLGRRRRSRLRPLAAQPLQHERAGHAAGQLSRGRATHAVGHEKEQTARGGVQIERPAFEPDRTAGFELRYEKGVFIVFTRPSHVRQRKHPGHDGTIAGRGVR